MGFYGNITNTSKTQFQFDHIYPNRRSMEQAMLSDGIYLGRHVLIEYDSEGLDGMKEVVLGANGFYYGDPDKRTLLTWANTYVDEVIYVKAEPAYIFYKRDSEPSGVDKTTSATFTQFTSGNEDTYGRNYAIDNEIYKSSRGYDSTVWQKVYTDNTERYVMIAELNTVVPKFAVAADAPTMNPVSPHFDTQSTDVYYKLHVQTPWGFRVAAPETIKLDGTTVINTTNGLSDGTTVWTTYDYDENNGIHEEKSEEKNAAIYFNRAGFKEYPHSSDIDLQDNYIKLSLASSGQKNYDDHNNTTVEQIAADDIQELSINLPAIGNMMSKAWDIIHGPNRDDARTDTNGSLQGRLNSFAAFYGNQIPVKQSNGTIVGSHINGASNYTLPETTDILSVEEDNENFTSDDAWIKTIVNSTNLKSGDKTDTVNNQSGNNGIAIHHTFHATTNSISSMDKNTGIADTSDSAYKTQHIPAIKDVDGEIVISASNSNTGTDDTIKVYTPYVDATGHVVGHNIETVTLPYGFKTITVGTESNGATGVAAAAGNVVADNTQGTLTLSPGNKWIHLTPNANNDTITVSHEVNNIVTTKVADTDLTTNTSASVTIPDWTYDEGGHICSKQNHLYKLPFGYGKIKGDSGNAAATATYDELAFTSDEWLTATVATDKVVYSHDASNPNKIEYTDKTDKYPSFGSTFTIEDWAFDEKGHQFNSNKSHTVTIPGIILDNASGGNVVVGLTLSKATEDNNKTATFTESKVNVGNLELTDYSVVSHTNANGSTDLQPKDTINGAFNKLQTQIYEEEVARANETVRAQEAEKALGERIDALDYSETANDTQIITQITQTDGKITNIARAAAGTLVLGSGYTKPNDGGIIAATDSLNSAIGKLEKNIEIEKSRAESAETTLTTNLDTKIAAVNNRITTLIGGENLNTAFDTLKEVADWLETNDSNADKVIDSIATLNGTVETTGSVAHSIKQAIDSEVNDRNAAITTAINALPVYTLASGSINGTVKFNNTDVTVTGLGSAAYTNSDSYASATILEDARFSFVPSDTEDPEFTTLSLSELFTLVANLQAQVNNLTQEIELLKNSNPTE